MPTLTNAELLAASVRRSPQMAAASSARLKWLAEARPNQITPGGEWDVWLIMAGRFFGKTRAGAEDMWWHCVDNLGARGAVVAPTHNDLRIYCFEGPSGLCNVVPKEVLRGGELHTAYVKSPYMEMHFANGSIIQGFSADQPDRLRGPGVTRVWCDELASWRRLKESWDNLNFMLREGKDPRIVVTTTPRPKPLVSQLIRKKTTVISRGSSYDNRANIAANVFSRIAEYEGTKIGDQEIHGQLLNPEESGVIKRSWLKMWPHDSKLPRFELIVISIDTAYSEKDLDKDTGDPDPTACQVWGVFMLPWEKPKDMFGRIIYPPMNVLLLDAWQEWLGFPDLVKRVLKARDVEYGAHDEMYIQPLIGPPTMIGTGRKADQIIVEDIGSGKSLRQTLAGAGIGAYAYNPGNADKLARLHIVSHLFSNGLVWVPEGTLVNPVTKKPVGGTGKFAKWADTAIEQWCTFAGEGSIEHDDNVDAMTQCLRVLSDNGLLQPTKRPEHELTEPVIRAPSERRENPYAA